MIVTKFCHPELYKLAKSTLVLANFSFLSWAQGMGWLAADLDSRSVRNETTLIKGLSKFQRRKIGFSFKQFAKGWWMPKTQFIGNFANRYRCGT